MQFVTAGESHGPCVTAIVSGVPAGLTISEEHINSDLARRQSGYGRGGRQLIETDRVSILSGVRFGKTLGSPITLQIENRDWRNWTDRMAVFGAAPADLKREVSPRPGHADLIGLFRQNSDDCRDILERASARETAARVAAAGIAREFLADLGVEIFSYVRSIGSVSLPSDDPAVLIAQHRIADIETSEVRCPDQATSEAMIEEIDSAKEAGESLGGVFRVIATGLLPGLGDYTAGPERLSSKIGAALFSIPAIKGVEIGLGFTGAGLPGSQVHDPITHDPQRGFGRSSNKAGGLEGGMTTGLPLVVTAAMKPIPTLTTPLDTVNIDTLEPVKASKERSDVCAVPAAAVVGEAELAFVLAQAYVDRFGAGNMTDIKANIAAYQARIKTLSR